MKGELAFIFPGQGSQYVGMLSDFIENSILQKTFAQASEVLGIDLFKLVCDGPENELNRTEITQPALLACSVGLWRLWLSRAGQLPVIMAGHSLGEYSALVCSGSIDFAEAIRIVHLRGKFMQETVESGAGAMTAIIGLADSKVIEICRKASAETGAVVEAVNFNAPGQVVIAGQRVAVRQAVASFKVIGAKKIIDLPVSVPSHCALMKPAAEKLRLELDRFEFLAPNIPVIQNVSADVCTDAQQLKENLIHQLSSPVRWVETIQAIDSFGVECFAECGAGRVLAGLNKRIIRRTPVLTLESAKVMDEALSAIK